VIDDVRPRTSDDDHRACERGHGVELGAEHRWHPGEQDVARDRAPFGRDSAGRALMLVSRSQALIAPVLIC
jgi:hypothetical protein